MANVYVSAAALGLSFSGLMLAPGPASDEPRTQETASAQPSQEASHRLELLIASNVLMVGGIAVGAVGLIADPPASRRRGY